MALEVRNPDVLGGLYLENLLHFIALSMFYCRNCPAVGDPPAADTG